MFAFASTHVAAALCTMLPLGDAQMHSDEPARGTKPASKLIYFESSIRNRTPYIVANTDRLAELPFDGLAINIPASWRVMTGERWTYEDSFSSWIEPLIPIFQDEDLGLTDNYLMAYVDREDDFLGDWTTSIENFRDLARLARDGGFVGLIIDNEEYMRPLWDWPSRADDPGQGLATYMQASRTLGLQIGQAIGQEFPNARVMFLHGPYIADENVPDFVRRQQFGQGEFEMFGPFAVGLLEGLGTRATLIDGGEVYALRTSEEFRAHAIWRHWGFTSSAHDASFLSQADRARYRAQSEMSFGVYTSQFPQGSTMSPSIMRDTLEGALRSSDRVVWFYSEEGTSAWIPEEFDPQWMNAVRTAKAESQIPAPRLKYGVEDLHRWNQYPTDTDLNGIIDNEDREAIVGELRKFELD